MALLQKEKESPNREERRKETEKNLDLDDNEEFADETIKRRFAAADTRALGDKVMIWLREIDEMRGKCRNIQGKLSGHMKKKIRYSGMAVEDLLLRIKSPTEDAAWIRMRNSELTVELREACRETDRLRNELEISRKDKVKLEREMGERIRKIEAEKDRIRNREEELNKNFSRTDDEVTS